MEKVSLLNDTIFLVRDFLSPVECDELIQVSELAGYGDAPITTRAGFVMRKDIRNNDRVIVDDPDLAEQYWQRLKEFVPVEWFHREAVGLNERFRFYRYGVGQRFAPHMDGFYERENGERSQFTFMVYLNEDCEGGETRFYHPRPPISVAPEKGTALVFFHHQEHEGAEVTEGLKYVIRTDIMFGPSKIRK